MCNNESPISQAGLPRSLNTLSKTRRAIRARCIFEYAGAAQEVLSYRPNRAAYHRGERRHASWTATEGKMISANVQLPDEEANLTLCAAFEWSYTPPKKAVVPSRPRYFAIKCCPPGCSSMNEDTSWMKPAMTMSGRLDACSWSVGMQNEH